MHAENAPTPGTTRPSALSAVSKSAVISTGTPVFSNARCADRKFPEP